RCRVHRAVFVVVSKDPTPAEIYTLSLHDALPISQGVQQDGLSGAGFTTDHGHAALERQVDVLGNGEITNGKLEKHRVVPWEIYVDRKSTRLNSSHVKISYAVFCLKKKNTRKQIQQ